MDLDVLIVDDEKTVRNALTRPLKQMGCSVRGADCGRAALKAVREGKPDLILLDMYLPDIKGLEVLKRIKKFDERIIVIIITGYESVENAVSAMKAGAYDYITKPINIKMLGLTISKACENLSLKRVVDTLKIGQRERYNPNYILGKSPEIRKIHKTIDKVSVSASSNVLIEGESGTGKELIAYNIHYKGPGADGPFVTVNCGTIPRELMESELFGYEAGAFTGASKGGKRGILEQAQGGTVFFDEIGELELSLQVKLLRVIEAKEFTRVGGLKPIKIDARVISATNKYLLEIVKKGEFRSDLYYRLSVVNIHVPPLRERGRDIILLAEGFIKEFNTLFHKDVKGMSGDASEAILKYHWPGNIRELRNVIERTMLFEEGEYIRKVHLPKEIFDAEPSLSDDIDPAVVFRGMNIDDIQKHLIQRALETTNGNQVRAAKLLGINRGAMRYRVRKYNINV